MPSFFVMEPGAINKISELIKENIGQERILLVSDNMGAKKYGEHLNLNLHPHKTLYIQGGDIASVKEIENSGKNYNIELIVGIGGGKVLDAVKLASHSLQIPFISVPTTLSNDGIFSPVAVIEHGHETKSIVASPPVGLVIDADIVLHSPPILLKAGIGDAISNISALKDWELAERNKKTEFNWTAYMLSEMGAELLLKSGEKAVDRELLKYLSLALVSSGIAMIITGNSRPASGAEHLISHALDKITKNRAPHGIQVGVATLFANELRGTPQNEEIKKFYETIGFPLTPCDIGIDKKTFMEAIKIAPYTRKGRFTILDIKNDLYAIEQAYERAYEC